MAESKMSVTIGDFTFSGEGSEEWLSKELDKIVERAEFLVKLAPKPASGEEGLGRKGDSGADSSGSDLKISLAKFLKEKDATANQLKKFLVTAVWLHKTKNLTRLKTADVSGALREASQSKINNPSDCLAKNVGAGDVERDGKEFYVTEHGYEKVGIKA